MPNGVKYSTTTPTGALRRDNVALGVTGNLGPTANTGFYSMPAPASGKYIINKVAASGVPLFFAPQNDTELIQFARNEGATGANTGSAAAVLAWIATQPNLEAANFEYPNIVTDGLVLNVDAGFVGSYPTTGTTWYDLSGNSSDVTLLNGPTFNMSGGGAILFDGSDDDSNISFSQISSDSGSIEVWVTRESETTNAFVFSKVGASTNRYYLRQPSPNTLDAVRGNPLVNTSFGTINVNTFYHLTMVWDSSTVYAYTNGILNSSISYTNPGTNISDGQLAAGPGNNMNMNLSIFKMYNRTLSAEEVLQNYNATKGRFGL